VNWISSAVSEATGTLSRASQGIKIAVDQDNILQAARIIESEAEYLKRKIEAKKEDLRVHEMGGDPVSREVARVLTAKFVDDSDAYATRCLEYVAMLEALARQLFESARTYGFTEVETAALFEAAKEEGDDRLTSRYGGLRAI
jgi:hypothetical protein